jgi:hypothetical protein
MKTARFQSTFILSTIIAALMTVATLGGLFIENLYRDNDFIARLWRGNDLVTLVVAVPLLIVSMIFAKQGSTRALLIWFGILTFTLYNYAFYLFAAAFNWFFWIYAALFSLSIFALIFGLTKIDAEVIGHQFSPHTPVKWISGYIAAFSIFIGTMWVVRSLSIFTTGEIPQDIVRTGHPTGIVYALDLSLVVPWMLLSAFWLWQCKPWGFILATMLMIKGFTYPLALVVMSIISTIAGTGYDPLTPFYGVLCVGCLVSCGLLLGNMKSSNEVKIYSYA